MPTLRREPRLAYSQILPDEQATGVRRTAGSCCIVCCMSATRTQLYLTEEQRRRIDEITRAEGTTLAEVVRRALDAYLEKARPDPAEALASTFGADPGAAYPDRDEWDRG